MPTSSRAEKESAQAFRRLIASEDYRRILRGRLGLNVEPRLPESFTKLLEALDQREHETGDTGS